MSAPVRAIPPSPDAIAFVLALNEGVQAEAGHEAFPEAVWSALADPERKALVSIDSESGAAAVLYRSDSFQPSHLQLGVGARAGADVRVISNTVDAVVTARSCPSEVVAWIPGSDPIVLAALQESGFVVDREQFQMRVPLPVADTAVWPPGVTARAFVPDRDEGAWLRVNNRAFQNHPDQGGWIAEVLDRRMAEPWFDSAGFLLAWRGSDLLGFCWTKVHSEPDPLGEIFVIGVDPDAQGLGLGRALVLSGLEHLAHERHCPTGLLYVASDNSAAVTLYRTLGFTTFRTDTALILERTRNS
jgi:mycothiol synthase